MMFTKTVVYYSSPISYYVIVYVRYCLQWYIPHRMAGLHSWQHHFMDMLILWECSLRLKHRSTHRMRYMYMYTVPITRKHTAQCVYSGTSPNGHLTIADTSLIRTQYSGPDWTSVNLHWKAPAKLWTPPYSVLRTQAAAPSGRNL